MATAGDEKSSTGLGSLTRANDAAGERIPLTIVLSYLSIKDIFTVSGTSRAFLLSARQAVDVVISNKLDAVNVGSAAAVPTGAMVRTKTGLGHGGGHGVHVIGADFSGVPSFCVTDTYVERVVTVLPVARLVLPMVPRLTDSGVTTAVKLLGSRLKVLSLEGNIKLASDELLKTLGKNAPDLVELNLSGCLKTSAQGMNWFGIESRIFNVVQVLFLLFRAAENSKY
jgi:hypothetical protein